MHRRTTAQIPPLLMVLFFLAGMPASLEAGLIGMNMRQLKETAAAPVLVTGQVLSVRKIERVPDGSLPMKAETWSMAAEFKVLRSYIASGEPLAADRIQVHFLAYGPSVTQFTDVLPPLSNLEPGQVLILPLKENKNPASGLWQLVADSGVNLTVPARAVIAVSQPPPGSAAAFLDREIVNTLSWGTSREVFAVAGYLAGQYEDLNSRLMPLLEADIGDDRQRWAEVAVSLLAAQGIPQPSVADLLLGNAAPKDWANRQSLFLAQAALQELKASPETDALLIRTSMADAPFHAWGSANLLLDFAGNPLTTEALRQALRNDLAGSSYIAFVQVRNGHPATLPEALARALKIADRPSADPGDLQGAAALLRDYGNDQQLKQLAALVRKYQTQNRKFYSVLWQYATENRNPREARVLAVVLRDRRIAFGQTRTCDFAVGVLERAVSQSFGSGGKTLIERNDAVTRAQAWLASHGVTD